jgi:hypothetical protein
VTGEWQPGLRLKVIIDHRNNAVRWEGFTEEPPIVSEIHHGEFGRWAPLFHRSTKLARHMPGIDAMQ